MLLKVQLGSIANRCCNCLHSERRNGCFEGGEPIFGECRGRYRIEHHGPLHPRQRARRTTTRGAGNDQRAHHQSARVATWVGVRKRSIPLVTRLIGAYSAIAPDTPGQHTTSSRKRSKCLLKSRSETNSRDAGGMLSFVDRKRNAPPAQWIGTPSIVSAVADGRE
jgi:hypothetical protein